MDGVVSTIRLFLYRKYTPTDLHAQNPRGEMFHILPRVFKLRINYFPHSLFYVSI
jgi:hypothetical protein